MTGALWTMIIRPCGILPTYRDQVRNYDTRINVYYGGAGSGKSYFVVQKIILKCLGDVRKVLVVRKVGATIKDSIWSLFLELLTRDGMSAVISAVNKSDLTITLVNGSALIFKGLDDKEKLKSINGITDIVIEEATELSAEDFTQLNLRLRSKKPHNQIHMMFNPVSKANWVYKYFFENGAPENAIVIQTTYTDNTHLPQEYVDELERLKNTNPAYYRIYALGEFATLDKLVFPNVETRLINPDEVTDYWKWVGMDFGYTNDPTAITWGYYDAVGKRIYITGEYGKTGMTNDDIAATLENLGLAKERIVADSAEPKSIAELKRAGIKRVIPSVKGHDSVKNGIDKLQRCDIIIDERCTQTREEFENYTWKKDKKSGEYINEPIDEYNHHIDSIRYGLQTVFGKRKNKQAGEYKSILN